MKTQAHRPKVHEIKVRIEGISTNLSTSTVV